MLKFDENKLSSLRSFDDVLQEKYGDADSEARKDFDARAKAWYYAELLKDERKRQKMTIGDIIYASTTYGQVFDIVYRDRVEVRLLNISANMIDDDL